MTIISDGVKDREYRPAEEKLLWVPLYEAVLRILGSTGVMLPVGDTNHENSGRTTLTTIGEEAAVFTYSEAVTAFDIAPSSQDPGRIPIVRFNGTDEYAESPDAAFWTRDDSASEGFSIGVWANVFDTAISRAIFSKYDDGGEQEWMLFINGSDDKLRLTLIDKTAGADAYRESDAAIPQGTLTFYVVTYDGSGGATAANGITFYKDGVLFASTAFNDGSYVRMRNSTATVNIGRNATSRYFDGEFAGGPLGPFWTENVLTADEVKRLFHIGRAALNV